MVQGKKEAKVKEVVEYLKKYPEAVRLLEIWTHLSDSDRAHYCPMTILEEECEGDPEWSVPVQDILGDICYDFCGVLFPGILRSDRNKFGCPCTCGSYEADEVLIIVLGALSLAKSGDCNGQ